MPRSRKAVQHAVAEAPALRECYADRDGDQETLDQLVTAFQAVGEADRELQAAVREAKSRGWSWEVIGVILGMSDQAARDFGVKDV